ncbi:short chain dehydrogenase family protein [Synechococcus sp. WH 8103]|nr:short chain dehydrogenase family protein [Synechococcus sp. WH 8103]
MSNRSDQRVLVTGGAGMIGSALVKDLINLGIQPYVVDNLSRGKSEYLDCIQGFDHNYFYNFDLSSPQTFEFLSTLPKFNAVIHLADIVAGIGYVFGNEGLIFNNNLNINSNVCNFFASQSDPLKYIYVGTACSYPLELQSGSDSVLTEDMLFPANPESSYGWSKLIGSLQMKYLFKERLNISYTTLMLHNVYGPNCDFNPSTSQVIPSLIYRVATLQKSSPLKVWGTGHQSRAFVHVSDVSHAILLTLGYSNMLPEYIQIGPDHPTTISDLSSMIISVSGKDIPIEYDTSKPVGDYGRSCDASLAKSVLGWSPNISISDGLADLYNWIVMRV